MIVRVLILWAVIALGVALSVLAPPEEEERRSPRIPSGPRLRRVGIWPVVGTPGRFRGRPLLGHSREAQKEASSLVALWDTLEVYPSETRDAARHDLICYMRAIVADDWPAMERGSRLEDPRTLAFGDRIRAGVRGLPLDDEPQRSAYGRASTLISDASTSRQQLLFFTEPEVPTVLWVLIYVGAFLLVFLVGTHYAERPPGLFTALGSVTALLTVIVVVLSLLDNPFALGARVQPDSMRNAIDLVSVDGDRTGVLRPCPQNPGPIATEGG